MKYQLSFNGNTAQVETPMPLTEGAFIELEDKTILVERVNGPYVTGTEVKIKPVNAG